jgi:hypothetical protein
VAVSTLPVNVTTLLLVSTQAGPYFASVRCISGLSTSSGEAVNRAQSDADRASANSSDLHMHLRMRPQNGKQVIEHGPARVCDIDAQIRMFNECIL